VQHIQRLLVQVQRLVLDHLDRQDAQRTDVDLGAVFFLLDDLGCHPVRNADHVRSLRLLVGELGAEAEVGDLVTVVSVEEDVAGLELLQWMMLWLCKWPKSLNVEHETVVSSFLVKASS
jgi:hypothetical protein